jgi:hypothetical protein
MYLPPLTPTKSNTIHAINKGNDSFMLLNGVFVLCLVNQKKRKSQGNFVGTTNNFNNTTMKTSSVFVVLLVLCVSVHCYESCVKKTGKDVSYVVNKVPQLDIKDLPASFEYALCFLFDFECCEQ